MATSLLGLYITDRVEERLIAQSSLTDTLNGDTLAPRHPVDGARPAEEDAIDGGYRSIETRGTSTDRVRLEERARKA